MLNILNIGIDRDLLHASGTTEAQQRHQFYANELPARLTHIVKAPRGGKDRIVLQTDNLTVWACPVPHWTLFPLKAYLLGNRLMRNEKFDILQVQEPYFSGVPGVVLAKRFKVPFIAGGYSDGVGNPIWIRESLLNRFADVLGRVILRQADAVRANSRAVADRLKSIGYHKAWPVPVHFPSADELARPHPARDEVRRRLLADGEGPLLVCVSRLVYEKDHRVMIDAFQKVRAEVPSAVLAVVGDGPLREELHAYAAGHCPEGIRWVGRVPHAEVPAYYQAADIFLLSSKIESSARVLTEALLAGVPTVTTASPGAEEAVDEGRTGFIVPIGDRAAFADAILKLARDPGLRATMKSNMREHVKSVVSPEALIAGLRAMYDAVQKRS